MKKEYDFKKARRGRFAKASPTLEGRGVQTMHPRVINVNFDVSQEVAAALRALRATGLFGNGVDCASIAEELLRKALFDPQVLPYWQGAVFHDAAPTNSPPRGRFACRACGHRHLSWAARCSHCASQAGLEIMTSRKKKA
jgi:hypothetical protein